MPYLSTFLSKLNLMPWFDEHPESQGIGPGATRTLSVVVAWVSESAMVRERFAWFQIEKPSIVAIT